jgi:hypothetical protein
MRFIPFRIGSDLYHIMTFCKMLSMNQLVRTKEKPQIRPICSFNMQLRSVEHFLVLIVRGSWDFYRRNLYSTHYMCFSQTHGL